MICNKCGTEFEDGAKFCPECGEKVALPELGKCPSCGAQNSDSAKFCRECGAALNVQLPASTVKPDKFVCQACGAEISEGVKFCSNCGAEFDWEDDGAEAFGAEAGEARGSNPLLPPEGFVEDSADTICPFCHQGGCEWFRKNNTTVKQKSFNIWDGICGMLCLGPFGLLCGLCGAGQEVEVSDENWYYCKKCGKQHISRGSALAKAEKIYYSCLASSLIAAAIFSLMLWLGAGLLVLIPIAVPAGMWYSMFKDLKADLGFPLTDIIDQDTLIKRILIAAIPTIIVAIVAYPIIESILGV